jgi:hypothetical protein
MMTVVDDVVSHYESISSETRNYFMDRGNISCLNPLQTLCVKKNMNKGNEMAINRVLKACPAAAGISRDGLEHSALFIYLSVDSTESTQVVSNLSGTVSDTIKALLDAYFQHSELEIVRSNISRCFKLAVRHWPLEIIRMIHDKASPSGIAGWTSDDSTFNILNAATRRQNVEIIKFIYQAYPAAALTKGDTPLYVAVKDCSMSTLQLTYDLCPKDFLFNNKRSWVLLMGFLTGRIMNVRATPVSEWADKFRFLLKRRPLATVSSTAISPVMTADEGPSYFARIALREVYPSLLNGSDNNDGTHGLRRLNYEERRGAMYLSFSSATAVLAAKEPTLIWRRLRKNGDLTIMREVVSFL